MTPLFITCIRGRLEVARCLIDHGADVNWTTPDRNCALRHAFRRGHRDLVRLLLSRGANIEAARENEDKTGLERRALADAEEEEERLGGDEELGDEERERLQRRQLRPPRRGVEDAHGP